MQSLCEEKRREREGSNLSAFVGLWGLRLNKPGELHQINLTAYRRFNTRQANPPVAMRGRGGMTHRFYRMGGFRVKKRLPTPFTSLPPQVYSDRSGDHTGSAKDGAGIDPLVTAQEKNRHK